MRTTLKMKEPEVGFFWLASYLIVESSFPRFWIMVHSQITLKVFQMSFLSNKTVSSGVVKAYRLL